MVLEALVVVAQQQLVAPLWELLELMLLVVVAAAVGMLVILTVAEVVPESL